MRPTPTHSRMCPSRDQSSMEESRVTMESGSSMSREWRTSRDPAGHGTGKRGSGVMGHRDLGSVFYLYLRGHSGRCSEVALYQSVFVLLSTKMRGAASHVEETTLALHTLPLLLQLTVLLLSGLLGETTASTTQDGRHLPRTIWSVELARLFTARLRADAFDHRPA